MAPLPIAPPLFHPQTLPHLAVVQDISAAVMLSRAQWYLAFYFGVLRFCNSISLSSIFVNELTPRNNSFAVYLITPSFVTTPSSVRCGGHLRQRELSGNLV